MADKEAPAIVTGSTASVKTMADDTLRVTIDIEPRHAQAAFAMFGMRGTPVAVARLTSEAALAQTRREDAPQATDYGKAYVCLFKTGWFHNPRVVKAFRVEHVSAQTRADEIKHKIHDLFGVGSLGEIDPAEFREWLALPEQRIADTLPRGFGEAA